MNLSLYLSPTPHPQKKALVLIYREGGSKKWNGNEAANLYNKYACDYLGTREVDKGERKRKRRDSLRADT